MGSHLLPRIHHSSDECLEGVMPFEEVDTNGYLLYANPNRARAPFGTTMVGTSGGRAPLVLTTRAGNKYRDGKCGLSRQFSTMFLWTAKTGDDANMWSRLFQKKVWRQLRMWARRARRAVFNRALADYNADRPRWFHYSASVEPDHGSHDPHFKYAPNWSWERQLTSRLSSPT